MFYRRLIGVVVLVCVVGLFYSNTTREYIKWTILFGMPALVIYSRQRQYNRNQWQWWGMLLIIAGLFTGYGFMLKDMPEHIAVRQITLQGDIYLTEGKYDQAIDKYNELIKYGDEDKARQKINDAEKQKSFAGKYEEAAQLVKQGKYEKARTLLKQIPRAAVVWGKASELLENIEGK